MPTDSDPDRDAGERAALLDRYEALRVPDVVDALDSLGFHANDQQCLMDRAIGPVFRDDEGMSHAGAGFAFTARYRPPRTEPAAVRSDVDERTGMWYDTVTPVPYLGEIREGDFVVLRVVHKSDIGLLGSRISLEYAAEGATGVVTDAGCRDVEEVAAQGVPVHAGYVSPAPGRLELEDTGVPVSLGGVDVRPGDMVVADGSGVAVVPSEHVEAVADVAEEVAAEDENARRELFERAGLDPGEVG
jgi:regulator of RNase E activity RraA